MTTERAAEQGAFSHAVLNRARMKSSPIAGWHSQTSHIRCDALAADGVITCDAFQRVMVQCLQANSSTSIPLIAPGTQFYGCSKEQAERSVKTATSLGDGADAGRAVSRNPDRIALSRRHQRMSACIIVPRHYFGWPVTPYSAAELLCASKRHN
jgi:hypothetical protein